MKTAYTLALEEAAMEKLGEIRIKTQERIDKELDEISHHMRNEPFPVEEN